MKKYTINDFKNINNSHKSLLEENIIKEINNLALLVGAPNYKKTPIFKDNKKWKKMKNFKKTKLVKNKETFDIITSLLNKLTQNNYKEIKDKIIEYMKELTNIENSFGKIKDIISYIFNIASKNKFWCDIYAQLCFDLNKEFPIMIEICKENFDNLLDLFKNIRIGNSDEDYELFCQINNENEKRKSVCCFFVNLMKYKIIQEERILNIIYYLIDIIKKNLNNKSFKNQNYEICENLYILIKNIFNLMENESDVKKIKDFINFIISINLKNYKGLTTKTYFKFMDLNDEISN